MNERRWVWAVWGVLGTLMFFSGFVSGNIVTMVVGVALAFGSASLYLTSYVASERRTKRALEVILVLSALGVVVYGFIISGSFVLGIITAFNVAMVLVAFILSYLLPRIRSESFERG
jgi:hypothetical protein